MADDHDTDDSTNEKEQQHPDPTAHDTSPGDDDTGTGPASHDAPDSDADDGRSAPDLHERLVMSGKNLSVMGRLRLHQRWGSPVELVVDGDAALRLLYRLKHGAAVEWVTDQLNPLRSSAHDAWLVVHPEEIVAAEWLPGVPDDTARGVSIDPVA